MKKEKYIKGKIIYKSLIIDIFFYIKKHIINIIFPYLERAIAFNMDYQQMARNGRNLACKEKKVHKHSYFLTDPLIFKNAYKYYFFNRSCRLRRVPVRPMASHVYGDSPMLYLIWLDSIPNLNFLSWIISNNFSKLTILACGHYWNR